MKTTKEILEEYGFWDDMARRKKREMQRMRDRKTSTSIVYSDTRGGEPETMEEYVARLAELEDDMEEIKAMRFRAFSEILRLAFRLKSQKQFDIIYRRYIHRDSWRRICRDTDVKKRSALDLHKRAVEELDRIRNKGT